MGFTLIAQEANYLLPTFLPASPICLLRQGQVESKQMVDKAQHEGEPGQC